LTLKAITLRSVPDFRRLICPPGSWGDDGLFLHLARRVVLDQEWVTGTATDEYVGDLHQAARVAVGLVICTRRGGSIAGTLAPTRSAVPAVRLGSGPSPELFVVYSADRGVIVTGYQCSSRNELAIPEGALWLL
jgi:hypothetical protein